MALSSYKEPTQENLREVLLEFALNCLIDQPQGLYQYAANYFDEMSNAQTKLIFDKYEEAEGKEEENYVIPVDSRLYVPSNKRRCCVYAEPYDPTKEDDSSNGSATFYPKTDEQYEHLREIVKGCLLFRALDEDQIQCVINAMFFKPVQEGDVIIKQFDDGDYFYVIESGIFDIFIASEPGEDPVKYDSYNNVGSFGELSLMYNMPRAATIKAATDGFLWALDRKTFRRIILKAAFKKRKKYEEFISTLPLLGELLPYEKLILADALVPIKKKAGDVIFRQGDKSDGMYFVESGKVSCTVYNKHINADVETFQVGKGDYFGELSLITKRARAATFTALEDTKLAFIDNNAFERILGSCIPIIKRNMHIYDSLSKNMFGVSLETFVLDNY